MNLNQVIEKCKKLMQESKSAHIVTLNPEMIDHADKNKDLNNAIKEAEIVIPDGIGVVLGLKLQGITQQRVPGIELAQKLLEVANNNKFSVAFLGAEENVLNTAITNIKARYSDLNVCYKHNGFFSEEQEDKIFEEIQSASPSILFVALGVPKQELLIRKYKKTLNRTIIIGVGGSFDVWANKVKRAPLFFRALGLEWFYRLLLQPSRFKRMFPCLPLFLIRVILNKSN